MTESSHSPLHPTPNERLSAQLRFILEADRLKGILRRSLLADGSRRENSAEHSWHISLLALIMREYAPPGLKLERVLKMLLIHDIVEIEAGDSFVYDAVAQGDKAARELAAAEKLYGLLPPDQRDELREAWDEFEARETPEARFAQAVDRLMPILHNYATQGRSWQQHNVSLGQVLAYNRHMADGAPALWDYARGLAEDAARRGWLRE